MSTLEHIYILHLFVNIYLTLIYTFYFVNIVTLSHSLRYGEAKLIVYGAYTLWVVAVCTLGDVCRRQCGPRGGHRAGRRGPQAARPPRVEAV